MEQGISPHSGMSAPASRQAEHGDGYYSRSPFTDWALAIGVGMDHLLSVAGSVCQGLFTPDDEAWDAVP